MSISRLPANTLYIQFSPEDLGFLTTEELEDPPEPVGQARAIEAIKFGTEILCSGYNIFALGPPGTGKHQIILQLLKQRAARGPIPLEWVYVNNFSNPSQPIAISFPTGHGKSFQNEIQQLIEDLRTTIPSIYESERYRIRRDGIIKEFKEKQDRAISDLQERAKKENVYLLTLRGGLIFAQGDSEKNIMDDETLSRLSKEEQMKIADRVEKYNEELADLVGQFPIIEKQMSLKIKELNKEMISAAVETLAKEIKEKYARDEKVSAYLRNMVSDIIENAKIFRRPSEERAEWREIVTSPLRRYEVNVLVDHSGQDGAPVIYEDNPTFMNLVGQIEHVAQMGALITDFTLIKPGALHRANGGYLILDAYKLLTSPYAWEGLKRALKSELIKIESLGQIYSLISTVTLKPEPIPLQCKVILIGERDIYQLLMRYDTEFSEQFRISADFENEMPMTIENVRAFSGLLGSFVRRHQLHHVDVKGVARVIGHSTRISEDSEYLSIRLQLISDLLKEADFFTRKSGGDVITEVEVQKAIDAQVWRASRLHEKILEETKRGTLLVDVAGERIGQVNALAVFEFGGHTFGYANRITAVARMGTGEVVDIERESKMGGPIHSKGVLILSGFLKSRFAAHVPLSISASLVFEQSYGPVEGDSASLAELSALLSALSQLPVRQSFAITGSVNQHGEVQPVGAINEKIEGYYDLCSRKGLSGEQGVLIPRSNVKHLALRADVVHSVEKSEFSIYAVDTVEDCIQQITGMPYSILTDKIESRLVAFADKLTQMKISKRNLNVPGKDSELLS